MTHFRQLVIALVLSGCGAVLGQRHPVPLALWQEQGLPRGECQELELRVQYGACRGGAAGCTERRSYGLFGLREYTLVTIRQGDPLQPAARLLPHEVTHAMAWCGLGNPNGSHTDPRLWSHYDSVQGRWVPGFEVLLYEKTR